MGTPRKAHRARWISTAAGLAARSGRRLAVAGAVLATALSISALPATAAVTTMTVRLDIDTHPGPSHDNNTYTVRIDVHLPTTRSDAEALINNGASIKLRVMGEDTWSDDTQIGPLTYTRGRIFAQNDGIHLRVSLAATHDQLNEDWGAIDTAGDEIYVKATWLDGTGTSLTKRSNKVTGRF